MKQVSNWWLYARILVLNVAVGIMFFTVTRTVPPTDFITIRYPQYSKISLVKSGVPTRLIINRLGIDLAVGVGSFNISDGSWTIGDNQAYYADMSVPLNDRSGTTLIYGHAQKPVFLSLANLRPGDKATVYSDSGYVFRYNFQSVRNVVPTDTNVLNESGKPTLDLQTCTGAWDSYRALYSFKLESVERS